MSNTADFLEHPWHITLSEDDKAYLIAVPVNKESDIELRVGKGDSNITLVVEPDSLADFCRTTLSILEERNLIEEDDD